MRSLRYKIYAISAMILLLVSCMEDINSEKAQPASGETTVNISFLVPDTDNQTLTKLSTAQEKAVNEIKVIWFDQNGDYVHNAVGLELNTAGNTHTCRILMNDGTYDIMILANSLPWFETIYPSGIPATMTKDDFISALIAECSQVWESNTIPMWGMQEGVTIDKNNDSVTGITLTRALARIDIHLASSISSVFELEEVTIYRNYRKGRLIPELDPTHWSNSPPKALQVSLPTGTDLINTTGKTFTVNNGILEKEIYIFETPAGENLSTALNDQNACLILKAKYNGSNSSYYRVDFTETSSTDARYIQLLRNNIYEINITRVERNGAATAAEALKGRPAHITYDISDLSKSGMNNIAWNGQHYLMASTDNISFWRDASSAPLRIQTNHPSGWKVSSAPSWITVTPNNSEYTAESQVTVTVTQNPSTTTPRTGNIILTAGELQLTINIEQSEQEEFSLTVSPSSLIFYATPSAAQTVDITTVPANMQYTLTYSGDFTTWAQNTPSPSTNPQAQFRPTNNSTGILRLGFITVAITHPDGRTLREDIAVRQYPGNNPFTVLSETSYPAIAQTDAKITVSCTQNWYLKRTNPAGLAQINGIQPSGTGTYNFTIAANNSYTPREITLVFATADDTVEYEHTIRQEAVEPYFFFHNQGLTNLYEYKFTGVQATTANAGFDINFPWRLTETGLNTLVSSVSHQAGTIYPVDNISAGKQENISFTSIDYTNRTGMPAAGTILNATAQIHSENTDPYPTGIKGTIKLSRTIPSVFDLISTTIAPATGTIPRAGGTITLTAGSNDNWSISATNGLNTPSATKGTHYEINSLTINIPENTDIGNGIDIDVYYTYQGTTVKTATFSQEQYSVKFDRHGTAFYHQLLGTGDVVTVTTSGNYPDLHLRLYTRDGPLPQIEFIPAGTAEVITLLNIPRTTFEQMAVVYIQYSTDGGTTWTSGASLEQFPGNYYHMSYFYSLQSYPTQASPEQMTWAEAMGVDTQFNTATHYNTWENTNRNNEGYTPTHPTGCGNYSESPFPNDWVWVLPHPNHMQEILRQQINGEYEFNILPGQKFHTSYDGGMDKTKLYWIENNQIKSQENANKNTPAYVRCVVKSKQ